ncbi:MAG: TAXI family TRAP transporter solute-binding subunit [Geminicoccaceae bacterium]
MRALTWPGKAGVLMSLLLGGGPVLAGDELALASGGADARTYAAAVGLSSLIKFELLPREKIDLRVLDSTGAIDNVHLLKTGDAELAILPSAIGHAARLGTGPFAGAAPATSFRAIATLWRDALHMVVREDDAATGTIDDLSDLKDGKVFLGEAETGMIDANRLLFADLGINADQAFELATLAEGDGVSAIKRGDVDAISVTAQPPEAMFDGAFNDDADLRLLDVTESQMNEVNGNHWLWTPYVIPAATYPGQDKDIGTIALSTQLVVRTDVDDDVVYAITKSIFENLDYLQRVDPSMADLSLDQAFAGMAMPLHRGALRYYEEAGLVPKTASDGEAPSQAPMPVRQDDRRPENAPLERYPDADVAGDLPLGVGGPLLRAAQGTTVAKERHRQAPAAGGPPVIIIQEGAKPDWHRRATF